MRDRRYDIWSDPNDPITRIVVKRGRQVPAPFSSPHLIHLGTAKVAGYIAQHVRAKDCAVLKTNIPFDPDQVFGEAF